MSGEVLLGRTRGKHVCLHDQTRIWLKHTRPLRKWLRLADCKMSRLTRTDLLPHRCKDQLHGLFVDITLAWIGRPRRVK